MQTQRQEILGIRAVALVELFFFLLIALVIDTALLEGTRFWETYPHPFWIIVILLSAQYGTGAGMVAVLFSSLALLAFNLPEQSIEQDYYSWLLSIASRPIMWLISALIIGELRNRHIRERDALEEALHESRDREVTIANSYDKLRGLKEKLELRIAGQMRAATDAYRAAQALETLQPQDVMGGVIDLVKSVLGAEKCSLYMLHGEKLENRLTYGWNEGDHFDKTLESSSGLYQDIIARQKLLSIVNSDDERVLGTQGILAAPIINKNNGDVLGMLKIEQLPFTELNLQTIETFRAVAEWVGMALANANYYQDALDDSVVNPEHNLMTPGYFQRFKDYIKSLATRLNFNVALLEIDLGNADQLDSKTRIKVGAILADSVDKALRTVDLAFDRQKEGSHYAIVLPTATLEGARTVQEKIEQALLPAIRKEAPEASFSFSVQMIHEAA